METIINELFNNNLSGATKLLESLLADKITLALAQKKQEIAKAMFSTLEEGNSINKKKIKVYFNRLGKESQGLSKKHEGRKLNKTLPPEKIKELISCSIEEAKINDTKRRNVQKKIGKELGKRGLIGSGNPLTDGRQAQKIMPSNVTKNLATANQPVKPDYFWLDANKRLQTEEEIEEAKVNFINYEKRKAAVGALLAAGFESRGGKEHEVFVHKTKGLKVPVPRQPKLSHGVCDQVGDGIKKATA